MPLNRYSRASILDGGKRIGTSRSCYAIYRAVQRGSLKVQTRLLKEGERLDIIAGKLYNDASLWWVIAAASGIGWGLQTPPGTVIRIPVNIKNVMGVVL